MCEFSYLKDINYKGLVFDIFLVSCFSVIFLMLCGFLLSDSRLLAAFTSEHLREREALKAGWVS